jgi:hypothetical protein
MRVTALSIALANLVACGGGGGGGGGVVVVPTEVAFSSFGAVGPNQIVRMEGTAVTATGDQTQTAITSMSTPAEGAATVRLTYDGSRALSGISVTAPPASVTFDRNSVSCSGATCVGSNANASGVAIDAFAVGWNYQTFGVWGIDTSSTTYALGAVSVGSPTAGNALPVSGNANFTGLAAGFYFTDLGAPFATAATMNAIVDFSARSILFSTTSTNKVDASIPAGASTPDPSLNLTGTLGYSAGVNAFSGSVSAGAGSGLTSGQASGRFYGPAAEEIGGVYSLSGPSGSLARMVGGFGGKKSP